MPDGNLLPMPGIYREVGQLVRAHRLKKKFSQEGLAQKVGHTRTSITNIEAGRQRIPLDLLYRLATALQVDVRSLIPIGEASLPPEVERKLPKQFDEADVRALKRLVTR